MTVLILGIAVFLSIHLLPAFPSMRQKLVDAAGDNGYRLFFSFVSLIGLALIVWGFARAPVVQLWSPPYWTRYVAMLLMLPVFVLVLAAYIPGEIRTKVKHPFLVAIKIWALAHLIANGDLASVILFGSFLAYAVVDRIALKRRPAAPAAPMSDRGRNDLIAVAGGLLLYVVFLLWLHPLLIGVSPLP